MKSRSPLLGAISFLAVIAPGLAQDSQQTFATDALRALAQGEQLRLDCLVIEAPFRATRLVHDVLFESAGASLTDVQALEGARGIAATHARTTVDDWLLERVQAFEGRRASMQARALSFKSRLDGTIAALEARDWQAFDHAFDDGLRQAQGEPYFEWRLRRVAAVCLGARGMLDERGRELGRLVELGRELRLPEAVVEDLGELATIELGHGRWRAAITLYREALGHSRAIGETAHRGPLWLGLGSAQANLGLYEAARESISRASAVHRARGATIDEAYGHLQASLLEASSARYSRALASGRRALELYASEDDSMGEARTRTHLAAVQSELGLIVDAEREVSLALAALGDEGDLLERGRAQLILGLARLDDGQPESALGVLDQAARLFEQGGDGSGRAEADYLRGRALLALERFGPAERVLRTVVERPRLRADALRRSLAWTALGDVLARSDRAELARDAYTRGIDVGQTSIGLEGTWRAHFGLGKLEEQSGRLGAALEAYLTAIRSVEEIRRVLAAPSLRLRYLGDKLELYRRATDLQGRSGDVEAAFLMSERLRARTLLEFAALRPARDPSDGSSSAARLRAAESQLTLLEMELFREARDGGRVELTERLESARAEHAAARRGVEIADSRGALLSGLPDPPDLRQVRARLGPTEVMLAYVTSDLETSVFVLRADGAWHLDLSVAGPRLRQWVDALLRPSHLLREGRTDVVNLGFDARIAHELYQALIEPVLPHLGGCELLWIVPDGPLRALPFAALVEEVEATGVDRRELHGHHRGARYLIESFSLVYLPSAGFLGSGSTDATGDALTFAAPDPLPAGAQLLIHAGRAAHGAGSDGSTLTGADASEARFKQLAPGARTLHLATHGYLDDRRPAYSRVALAPGPGEDGWLHAWEVESLTLGARSVVLAACETLGSTGRAEGLLGLARAFLVAGARSVIATAWRVDDEATAWLMEHYRDGLRSGLSSAAALRRAQIATLRQGGRIHLSYANPFFWAGFFQIGGD